MFERRERARPIFFRFLDNLNKWKDAFSFHLKCYLYKITRHCTETSLVCIYISKREKTFSGAQIYKQQKRMFEKTPIL